MESNKEQKWVSALREIKTFLDNASVKYWLNFGTLLGAVREGKMIAWDGDIDLSMPLSEVDKILKIVPEISKNGWRVDLSDHCIYFWKKDEGVVIGIAIYRFYEDKAWVFWLHKDPKFNAITKYFYRIADRIKYRKYHRRIPFLEQLLYNFTPSFLDDFIRRMFFKISFSLGRKDTALIFPSDMINNLDQINFYGMTFNIPSRVEKYLSLAYDADWRRPDPNWKYEKATAIDYNFFDHRLRDEFSLF